MKTGIKGKMLRLQKILKEMKTVLIAYSGGVDSTLLLKVAKDTLGKKNILAVTADSPIYPKEEIKDAEKRVRIFGLRHLIIKTEELKSSRFLQNSPERCYHCKRGLFAKLTDLARKENLLFVLDGTNSDDYKDFRPGTKAAREFKVRSPLKEAGFTKNEVRILSKKLSLPTWDKPALACLASRIPYGRRITTKNLAKVYQAEKFLRNLGVSQVRVRDHKHIVRIEALQEDIFKILKKSDKIISKFKRLGYNYITVDLEGYRSGSMNEVL